MVAAGGIELVHQSKAHSASAKVSRRIWTSGDRTAAIWQCEPEYSSMAFPLRPHR